MNWFKKLFRCNKEIDWLQTMQKLEVRDGDIVVVRHPGLLNPSHHANMGEAYRIRFAEFGYRVNVMIFDEGMGVGVLTKG